MLDVGSFSSKRTCCFQTVEVIKEKEGDLRSPAVDGLPIPLIKTKSVVLADSPACDFSLDKSLLV